MGTRRVLSLSWRRLRVSPFRRCPPKSRRTLALVDSALFQQTVRRNKVCEADIVRHIYYFFNKSAEDLVHRALSSPNLGELIQPGGKWPPNVGRLDKPDGRSLKLQRALPTPSQFSPCALRRVCLHHHEMKWNLICVNLELGIVMKSRVQTLANEVCQAEIARGYFFRFDPPGTRIYIAG